MTMTLDQVRDRYGVPSAERPGVRFEMVTPLLGDHDCAERWFMVVTGIEAWDNGSNSIRVSGECERCGFDVYYEFDIMKERQRTYALASALFPDDSMSRPPDLISWLPVINRPCCQVDLGCSGYSMEVNKINDWHHILNSGNHVDCVQLFVRCVECDVEQHLSIRVNSTAGQKIAKVIFPNIEKLTSEWLSIFKDRAANEQLDLADMKSAMDAE